MVVALQSTRKTPSPVSIPGRAEPGVGGHPHGALDDVPQQPGRLVDADRLGHLGAPARQGIDRLAQLPEGPPRALVDTTADRQPVLRLEGLDGPPHRDAEQVLVLAVLRERVPEPQESLLGGGDEWSAVVEAQRQGGAGDGRRRHGHGRLVGGWRGVRCRRRGAALSAAWGRLPVASAGRWARGRGGSSALAAGAVHRVATSAATTTATTAMGDPGRRMGRTIGPPDDSEPIVGRDHGDVSVAIRSRHERTDRGPGVDGLRRRVAVVVASADADERDRRRSPRGQHR